MGQNYFDFKTFRIEQARSPMRVNTDACLLGSIVPPRSRFCSMLDVGSGTGVLALMMAHKMPRASIVALEPHPGAYLDLVENIGGSPWPNRIRAVQNRVQEFSSSSSFDLIISNPPYFSNSLSNADQGKRMARHFADGDLLDWLKMMKALLSDDGEIWLILPTSTALELCSELEAISLDAHRRIDIKSFPSSSVIRCIVAMSARIGSGARKSSLTLYREKGVYSEQAVRLLRPFYASLS